MPTTNDKTQLDNLKKIGQISYELNECLFKWGAFFLATSTRQMSDSSAQFCNCKLLKKKMLKK